MASPVPSAIRRLAFQILFQLDAVRPGSREAGMIDDDLFDAENAHGLSDRDQRRARELAEAAYGAIRQADEIIAELAPEWPARRQPAVDRAILRLAHHEMTSGRVPAPVAIDEAVELAKTFGTDRSPAFVNGVLDALAKRAGATDPESHQGPTGTHAAG